MSATEPEEEETEWTKANLQKLLASMKESIPEHDRMAIFTEGMKTLDWKNVAFSHFSPKECQQKWQDMLEKMRTVRTLTELIVEAEDDLSNGDRTIRMETEDFPLPKKPGPPNTFFYRENRGKFQKQHPDFSPAELFKLLNSTYKELPDQDKVQYIEKYQKAKTEYKKKMVNFMKTMKTTKTNVSTDALTVRQGPPSSQAKYRREMRKTKKTTTKRIVSTDALTASGIEGDSRDHGLPTKPPRNGYLLFCEEQRCALEAQRAKYINTYTQKWREMTVEQRKDYATRCQDLNTRYTDDLKDFGSTLDGNEQTVAGNAIKRLQRKCMSNGTKKKLPVEPKLPPRSGTSMFIQKKMKQLEREFPDSTERFLKVNDLWKDLSKKERESYALEAKKSVNEYSVKLQKWFKTLTPTEQEDYWMYRPGKHKYLGSRLLKHCEGEIDQHRPSDSEDEDMEDSSDEDSIFDEEEEEDDEEEEKTDDNTFDMY